MQLVKTIHSYNMLNISALLVSTPGRLFNMEFRLIKDWVFSENVEVHLAYYMEKFPLHRLTIVKWDLVDQIEVLVDLFH